MREEDERREQQRCNFTVFLNASQAAVLVSSSTAERGEERRLSPCVGGRGEEAQIIIYPFRGEMKEHAAAGRSPGPASSASG